ncbi:hypothetical protein QOZ95_003957 [Paenibacillus brasilensis]|uniref:Uncharacterized protein n=1 Tax=Paenibacillus brasilensis TaxID=128574 RepID=A0ABU0L345_9BACL|nr:hypothetical protein [Paenibacillus brasilensis]
MFPVFLTLERIHIIIFDRILCAGEECIYDKECSKLETWKQLLKIRYYIGEIESKIGIRHYKIGNKRTENKKHVCISSLYGGLVSS